jgi:hypothetical protein
VQNLTITNYDDTVCIKPLNNGDSLSQCACVDREWGWDFEVTNLLTPTSLPGHDGPDYALLLLHMCCRQDYIVRDCTVFWGVGMSVGSVPPNTGVNCIRNITFENVCGGCLPWGRGQVVVGRCFPQLVVELGSWGCASSWPSFFSSGYMYIAFLYAFPTPNQIHFQHPIKTVYIKSNPGTEGSGIIDSITYRNITAVAPLWYPIWIGPQVGGASMWCRKLRATLECRCRVGTVLSASWLVVRSWQQQEQPGNSGTGCSFAYPSACFAPGFEGCCFPWRGLLWVVHCVRMPSEPTCVYVHAVVLALQSFRSAPRSPWCP